jgi:hypothetical protein
MGIVVSEYSRDIVDLTPRNRLAALTVKLE